MLWRRPLKVAEVGLRLTGQCAWGIIVAFYVLHYPVIATLTYALFGVWGWTANVYLQLVVVLAATVVITIGIIELIIRPIPPLRTSSFSVSLIALAGLGRCLVDAAALA